MQRHDLSALVAVALFAGTFPATRLAMAGGVTPLMNMAGRLAGAAVLAAVVLLVVRSAWPTRSEWRGLAVAGLGVGVVFPWALSQALTTVGASHAAVVMACLPLVSTFYAGWRGHVPPPRRFWVAGGVAGALVLVFVRRHAPPGAGLDPADLLLLLAMAGAAVGYVEGARLTTPTRPGWQVISWMLVACLPLSLPLTAISLAQAPAITASAWAGLAYATVFSMYVGFFPWYAAMAALGVARVSLWQYLQPFLAMAYAVVLLGETLDGIDLLLALGVVGAIAWGRRAP